MQELSPCVLRSLQARSRRRLATDVHVHLTTSHPGALGVGDTIACSYLRRALLRIKTTKEEQMASNSSGRADISLAIAFPLKLAVYHEALGAVKANYRTGYVYSSPGKRR